MPGQKLRLVQKSAPGLFRMQVRKNVVLNIFWCKLEFLKPKLLFAFKHFDRSAIEFGGYYVFVFFLFFFCITI